VKKLVALLVALLVVGGLGAYAYFTPHLALERLHAAAESEDMVALGQQVDFPAVRASLKQQIKARIEQRSQTSTNPLVALGSALAGSLTDPAVDALVTPENLAKLLRGEAFGSPEAPRLRLDGSQVPMAYNGWDEFVVGSEHDSGFRIILRRDGLFDWTLTDVRLPDSWVLPSFSPAVPPR
jgi:hypothetical protein